MATTSLKQEEQFKHEVPCPSIHPKKDIGKTMMAVEWQGAKTMKIVERPKPMVTDAGDALIRVTTSTICGSDLHLYHNEISGMEKGDILGHEFMGIVEDVGPEVKNFKPGDRVVVSAVIACGQCKYCQEKSFSFCNNTNPSQEMEKMYGQRISGIFGYSHLTGGYEGGQAEFARVPLADINLLKITGSGADEKYLFLSDIVCTGWHACELGKVKEGDIVVVWGCGPVGLMAQMWAKFRGASRVIAVDGIDYRLKTAKDKLGSEVIDFREEDPITCLHRMIPTGADVCIDAVGFRFPKSLLHKFERAMRLETDAPQILSEAIMVAKKGGILSVVGDYFAYANQFPIGALMEKGITLVGSQVHVQKYWNKLLDFIESGKVDPTFVISHYMDLAEADEAYRIFDEKEDNALKIILKPSFSSGASSGSPTGTATGSSNVGKVNFLAVQSSI